MRGGTKHQNDDFVKIKTSIASIDVLLTNTLTKDFDRFWHDTAVTEFKIEEIEVIVLELLE